MDKILFVSLLAAILNSIMSVVVPCLMEKAKFPKLPLLEKVRIRFELRRTDIMASSITTFVVVYVALMVSDHVDQNMIFGNLNNISKLSRN
jgi:hypothetical protein